MEGPVGEKAGGALSMWFSNHLPCPLCRFDLFRYLPCVRSTLGLTMAVALLALDMAIEDLRATAQGVGEALDDLVPHSG